MEKSDANVKHKSGITVVLSLDEHQAAELIAIGKADEEVARILGVEIKTIYQWQRKPEFIVALNMLRAAVWGQPNNFAVVKESPYSLAEKAKSTNVVGCL